MGKYATEAVIRLLLLDREGHCLITADGSAILALNGEERVLILEAEDGENFRTMSDEVVNAVICGGFDQGRWKMDV